NPPVPNSFVNTSVRAHVKVYLMYRPQGRDSIWIPLSRLEWRWCASADRQNAKWHLHEPSRVTLEAKGLDVTRVADIPEWKHRLDPKKQKVRFGPPPQPCSPRE